MKQEVASHCDKSAKQPYVRKEMWIKVLLSDDRIIP